MRYRVSTRRMGVLVCCGLGLLFALGPILHGVFHVGEMPHRHAAGSVHSHDEGPAVADAENAFSGVHHRNHGHSHLHGEPHLATSEGEEPSESETCEDETESQSCPPTDVPPGDEGSPFFLTLEIEASSSIGLDGTLASGQTLVKYATPRRVSVFSNRDLGSVSPRGPPKV